MVRSAILAFVTLALAVNSHSLSPSAGEVQNAPCVTGQCSHTSTSGHTIKIWGREEAISDVTDAAGWEVLDCDSKTVRLVCKGDDQSQNTCGHLFNGSGPVDKIVRLPESCGAGPFARIAGVSVADDQKTPSSLSGKLRRRDGKEPQVHTLSVDHDYHSSNARHGEVNFEIRSSIQADTDVNIARRWDVNKTVPPSVTTIDKTVNVLNTPVQCPAGSLSMKADAHAKANLNMGYTVVASGSVMPPKVTSFLLTANIDGSLNGGLSVTSTAVGNLSGNVNLVPKTGLPKEATMSIPGIMTVTPSYQVDGGVTATLNAPGALSAGLMWQVDKVQVAHPSNKAPTGTVAVLDTPVTLSSSPSDALHGEINGHIRYRFIYDVTAFNSKGQVFVDIDSGSDTQLTSPSKSACFEIDASNNIGSSSTGPFFGLLGSTSPSYVKQYVLANQCPAGHTRRSEEAEAHPAVGRAQSVRFARMNSSLSKRALTCPQTAGAPQTLISQTIPTSAATVKA